MKGQLILMILFLFYSASSHSKIITINESLFIEEKEKKIPIFLVNKLIDQKMISKVTIYDNGNIHLLSFSKDEGPSKLYSVDEKGFTYLIEPFSSYSISKIGKKGRFKFKEVPGKYFTVDAKGLFVEK